MAEAIAPAAALQRIGRELLAPAFAWFVRRAIARIRHAESARVFFLAREGWLLEKLWRALGGGEGGRYLEVSRRATALASVERFGARELALYRRQPGVHDAAGFLRSFNLPPEEAPSIDALLADPAFQARAGAHAERARARLRRYLERAAFFGPGPVALLDVGWQGTIQDNLARLPGAPELDGYYLGLFAPGVRKHGLLYDGRGVGLTARAPLHFVQLFELAARAPTGMTIDYDDAGAPVFADEQARNPALAGLQSAILEGARALPPELDPDAIRRRLERFIFLPEADELYALGALSHSDDWARAESGPLVSGARAALLRPREYADGFYRAYWKPGYLRITAGPLACRAFWAWERLKAAIRSA